jgi:hypothetical protein
MPPLAEWILRKGEILKLNGGVGSVPIHEGTIYGKIEVFATGKTGKYSQAQKYLLHIKS